VGLAIKTDLFLNIYVVGPEGSLSSGTSSRHDKTNWPTFDQFKIGKSSISKFKDRFLYYWQLNTTGNDYSGGITIGKHGIIW